MIITDVIFAKHLEIPLYDLPDKITDPDIKAKALKSKGFSGVVDLDKVELVLIKENYRKPENKSYFLRFETI